MAITANATTLTFNDATTQTTAGITSAVTSLNGQTGAITNTDYDVIGSYVIAAEDSFTAGLERLPNVTVAGSTLVRSTYQTSEGNTNFVGLNGGANLGVSNTSFTSLSLSGTWRRMTRSDNNTSGNGSGVNLYVRIS
jgi:hypothetical protein